MANISFTKVDLPYGWLGNMSPSIITWNGKTWRTCEAVFQSMRFSNPEIQELIRLEKSPMSCKMKSKKYKSEMKVEPMSKQDVQNMKTCLLLKFSQNPVLLQKLLLTKDHVLIEDIGSRKGERHLFWGMRRKGDQWEGKNTLGKLLMEVRDELKHKVS